MAGPAAAVPNTTICHLPDLPDVPDLPDLRGMALNALNVNASSLCNLSVAEDEGMYVPYEQRVETYLVPALFLLIFLLGTLGNGTLVLVFIRHRGIRTVPNIYIFSLALGDLLVILTSVPFTSTLYTVESWPYGTAVCKVSEVAKDVSIGVSVLTLTALSGDRYVAIVSPLRRHSSSTARRHTVILAASIWIAAILLAIPDAIIAEVQELELDKDHFIKVCTCFPTSMGPEYPKVMVVARFLVLYLLPLIVITAFYACIAFHLFLSVNNLNATAMAGQNTATQIKARKKVAKTVLSFVVIFVICFAPYHGVTMWFFLDPNAHDAYNGWWHALRIAGFVLSFLNSCVNPVALYFVSGQFRKYFNRYLFNAPVRRGSSRTRVHFHSVNTGTLHDVHDVHDVHEEPHAIVCTKEAVRSDEFGNGVNGLHRETSLSGVTV